MKIVKKINREKLVLSDKFKYIQNYSNFLKQSDSTRIDKLWESDQTQPYTFGLLFVHV